MRDWSFGGNGLPQFLYGHVTLIEQPWWLSVIEWWSDHGCSFIPPIPLPNWPKIHWDKDDPEYVGTPREWYGDLEQMYCSHVATKLTMWVWRHPKRKTYEFEVGWGKLKEIMYEYDKEFFDRMEDIE